MRWLHLVLAVILTVNDTLGAPDSATLRRQKRIVGGSKSLAPPEDDPVVFVNKNGRDGRIYGNRDEGQGFYVYRGIRFGEPPVGRHRFQRPKGTYIEGDINATTWGPPCPQPDNTNPNKIVGTEDCLFLNVFTPALPDGGNGYPVLIWIHGGGFRRGAACQYRMRNLIKKRMVVVSIQYRLGSLGFLSTGTKELPGNNGMFDMTLAVNWVRDYISFFGGDPTKIIAFGHGTGASSALLLAISKFTRDYFSGLIAMSGTILSQFAVDKDPTAKAKAIAKRNDCPTDNIPEMIRCLQELPVEKIIASDSLIEQIYTGASGFISGLSNILGAGPVIDGEDDERSLPNLLTQQPESILSLGNFPKIPLLTGVLKDETGGAVFGRFRKEIQDKLETVPQFLNNDLIKNLQSTIADLGSGNKSFNFVPAAFTNYLDIIGGGKWGSDLRNGIAKVAEATSDALFNAPTFLMSQQWSKQAKTFLYSFDHTTKKRKRRSFLSGLPIVEAAKESVDGLLGHGDELGYIFGENSIFGEKMETDEPDDPEDEEVTETFTDIIANFARNGVISVPSGSSSSNESTILPSFGGEADDDSFISIATKPKIMQKFRFCEMGLWTGLVQRVTSKSCGLFKSSIEMVQRVGSGIVQTINYVPSVILQNTIGNLSLPNVTIGQQIGENILSRIPSIKLRKDKDDDEDENKTDSKIQFPFLPRIRLGKDENRKEETEEKRDSFTPSIEPITPNNSEVERNSVTASIDFEKNETEEEERRKKHFSFPLNFKLKKDKHSEEETDEGKTNTNNFPLLSNIITKQDSNAAKEDVETERNKRKPLNLPLFGSGKLRKKFLFA